jgi:hypothetical protein
MAHYNAVPQQRNQGQPQQPAINSFDEADASCAGHILRLGLARAESMDVQNDPRFFAKNVMDKRLSAFKSLTLVSSLMFGTSLGQCFKLKKNMNFGSFNLYVGNIAYWQFAGFLLSVMVAVMCLLSLYVIAHQLFYTYRLMTAGPTGFEQASVFYLTRVITMWRHLAIKCLFNGLWLFIFLVGIQLFVKFYKDADSQMSSSHQVWALNLDGGTSQNITNVHFDTHQKLNMKFHACLAYFVLAVYLCCTAMLYCVRRQHMAVFRENYKAVKGMTNPIENTMRSMAYRTGAVNPERLLET